MADFGLSGRRSDAAGPEAKSLLTVEVEVLGGTLLEPQSIVIRSVLEEFRRLLKHVFVLFWLGRLERLLRVRVGGLGIRYMARPAGFGVVVGLHFVFGLRLVVRLDLGLRLAEDPC